MKNKEFIAQCCRLIDQCHGQRPDHLWFATWMACKSPYFDFSKNFEIFWLTKQLPAKTSPLKKIKLALRLLITLCSVLIKSIYLKTILRAELKTLNKLQGQEINLVRTFLYKTDPRASDPVWGDLLDLLVHGEKPVVTIYVPHFPITLCKKIYSQERHNFPFLVFISPLALIKNYFVLLVEAFKKINFEGDYNINETDLHDLVTGSYQDELLTPSSLINLAFLDVFEVIINKYQIHKAYLTFENNPWEKMFYLAKNKSHSKLKVIGFQHASIQEGATNYLLSAYEAQNAMCPDKIMCVGEYTSRLIKESPHYKNIPIQVGCALRHSYLEEIEGSTSNKDKELLKLLVVLDGTLDTINLIKLVEKFVSLNKVEALSVRIKEHPNLLIKNFYPQFLNSENILSKKITIANYSLQDNLEWSDIILYTGTTVCIEALKMGKAVINYNFSLFNYDPLFQFSEFKWEVANAEELCKVLDSYLKLVPAEFSEKQLAARKFVSNYFTTCSKQNIERFL